jgi:hypothetical protein
MMPVLSLFSGMPTTSVGMAPAFRNRNYVNAQGKSARDHITSANQITPAVASELRPRE